MPNVSVEFVPADWARLADVDHQLFEVLYRDFGVPPEAPWRHTGDHGTLAVAITDDGQVVGSARLLADGGPQRQVRQLAVAEHARGLGIGRVLVEALEEAAVFQQATSIQLNARECAYDFYLRLGYDFDGDTFISELTGIPHRRMVKDLSGWRCIACRKKRPFIWLEPTS